MSPKITSLICVLGILLFTNGCHVYEDNFTAKGQLYKLSGIYGLNANCGDVIEGDSAPEGKNAPDFMLINYFRLDTRTCGIESITKDGNGFLLEPTRCTSDYKRMSGGKSTFKYIEPFQIRVERIEAHTITVKEKNKPTLTLVQCDEN